MTAPHLPAAPGSYVLVLAASAPATIAVGRLGEMEVAPGWYLYTGSALGGGGLAGRLRHHLRPVARPHWHIDYLRQVAELRAIWYVVDTVRWEHWPGRPAWADGGAGAVRGFWRVGLLVRDACLLPGH